MLKVAYDQVFRHPLADGHRFPMIKYDLIPEQLLYEGVIQANQLFAPDTCNDEILCLTHDEKYIQQLNNCSLDPAHIRRIGFPLSPALVIREKKIMQGTIDCALHALKNGVSLNVAGGTHHAFTDRGEGFCLLNDLAVAANYLLYNQLAKNILIVDLDVHQGNGTAQIFANNPNVFTFSMHGKNNYPFKKEKSNLDIEMNDGVNDECYLSTLIQSLNEIIFVFKPDFIFYQSGVDILKTDKLGKLNISLDGCKKRDEIVFKLAKSIDAPIVAAMGGGYSTDIKDIVNAHCNTFKVANELFFS